MVIVTSTLLLIGSDLGMKAIVTLRIILQIVCGGNLHSDDCYKPARLIGDHSLRFDAPILISQPIENKRSA
jgi:hypothetical protein